MTTISRLTLAIVFALAFVACKKEYTPKPKGYYRIDLEEPEYKILDSDCAFSFEKNESAKWLEQPNCWGDIKYPKLKATVQLTYKEVNDNLETLLNEGHRLAYEHTVKADGISENLIFDQENRIFGLLYRIKGNAATNTQFFVTDSSNHFLRGVVYFYAIPNADSLRPVNEFMDQEILHLINTLKWQN